MSQTREHRMYLAWKAEKKRHDYRRGASQTVLMRVATRFRVPIRVVRDAVETQRAAAATGRCGECRRPFEECICRGGAR